MEKRKCENCGWRPKNKCSRPKDALMQHYFEEHSREGFYKRQEEAIKTFRKMNSSES